MNRALYLATLFSLVAGLGLSACSQLPRSAATASEIAPTPDSLPQDDDVRERVIIGPDNRRRTPAQHTLLTRAVGQLEAPRSNDRVSRCTATSISPNHLLTSAHCVYDIAGGQPRLDSDIYFYPGADEYNQMPFGRFRVTRIHHPERYDPLSGTVNGLGYDIAVLEVENDDTGRDLGKRVGFRGFWGRSALEDGIMTTLGYPGDKATRVQYIEEDCAFDIFNTILLRSYCDVFRGQSGSPALIHSAQHGDSFIHGVVSGETDTANYVTRITSERHRIIRAIIQNEYSAQTSSEEERWQSMTLLDSQRINIVAHNTCRAERLVALQHRDLQGNWTTNGFFPLPPGSSTEIGQTRNSIFYLHVRDQQHNVYMDGSHRASLHGSSFGFRQMNHSHFGDVVVRLCD